MNLQTDTIVVVPVPTTAVLRAQPPASVPTVPVLVVPGPPGPAAKWTVTGTATVNLSGHQMVRADPAAGLVPADWATAADATADLWLTTGATTAGGTATATTFGRIDEPSWNWLPGPIYLAAAGGLTQLLPTHSAGALFLRQIATALGPHSLFLNPAPATILS